VISFLYIKQASFVVFEQNKQHSILGVVEWRKQAVRPVGERYVMRCPQRITNLLYIRKLENKHAPGVVGRNCIIPHCPSNLGAIVYSDYRRHGISTVAGIFCPAFSLAFILLGSFLFGPRGALRAWTPERAWTRPSGTLCASSGSRPPGVSLVSSESLCFRPPQGQERWNPFQLVL
jgi:hypothetical protein